MNKLFFSLRVLMLLLSLFLIAHSISCGETCRPACRNGFTCVDSSCVSVCNPECDSGEICNESTGECETEDTTTTEETTTEETTTDEAAPF